MPRKESKVEDFAEELGNLLGTARAKAEGWLGQRKSIAAQLATIRDTASELLRNLTEGSASSVEGILATLPGGRRRQRRSKIKRAPAAQPASPGTGKRRRISAAGRARISAAQKARWAKLRAGEKKKQNEKKN
jgi:hypothetical protein